jgi:hypothetical protein
MCAYMERSPMDAPLSLDRRKRRSNQHDEALRYQLESTLKRGRMSALALADRSGILLAWAGEAELCQELGAIAPVVAHGWAADWPGDISTEDVSVRSIECYGDHLYLASLGGGVARDALLAHSARGIRRILTAN